VGREQDWEILIAVEKEKQQLCFDENRAGIVVPNNWTCRWKSVP
jgi:hypothetical protein